MHAPEGETTEQRVQSGPFVADATGVYSRAQGIERWLLVGLCLLGLLLIALLPWPLEQRMHTSLALIAGCAIGSLAAVQWRRMRPLPLLLLQGDMLIGFAHGWLPQVQARFPLAAVTSVALDVRPDGLALEWLFRGGEQGRLVLGTDLRLQRPLTHFLSRQFGDRFKERRA